MLHQWTLYYADEHHPKYTCNVRTFDYAFYYKIELFEITILTFLRPVLEIGFSDKTLKVQSMDLDSSTHAGGIIYGTMTVVGHELGLKRICLDSVANPR